MPYKHGVITKIISAIKTGMYVVPRAGTKIIIQLLLFKSCKFAEN